MRTLLAVLLVCGAADAGAAILYKLVDPYGAITFSDSVPRGFMGNVTRMDIDTGTNLITPTPSGDPVVRAPIQYEVVRRPIVSDEERLRTAAQRIEDARIALANAQNNSTAEDWFYYGSTNPMTGARRGPRPEYQARLDQLAANVVVAEAEYEALRQRMR